MLFDETIVAIATPLGSGGIGIIRISGTQAKEILQKVFSSSTKTFCDFRPWTLHRGHFLTGDGHMLDDVLAVFMPAPHTFTGEDVAEIHCHGGQMLVAMILQEILRQNTNYHLRLAENGEFSRRAFLNGRMDLTQAEAVAEMINAKNGAALQFGSAKLEGLLGKKVLELRQKLERLRMELCVALDFPEEEVDCLPPQAFSEVVQEVKECVEALLKAYNRSRPWQEGATVVLAGAVNAGKSSTLNALLGYQRALVTDIAGTTRDFLEETIDIDGLSVKLIDTAGLRDALDSVERLGIEQSRSQIAKADLVLLVLDGNLSEDAAICLGEEGLQLARNPHTLIIWNKCDVAPGLKLPLNWQEFEHKCVCISAKEGHGLDTLCANIKKSLLMPNGNSGKACLTEPQAGDVVPNLRQAELLRVAAEELSLLHDDLLSSMPYDICAVRLDVAVNTLGQITGLDTPDELLDKIFATFCIGK